MVPTPVSRASSLAGVSAFVLRSWHSLDPRRFAEALESLRERPNASRRTKACPFNLRTLKNTGNQLTQTWKL